jgi:hypothetical protein
MADALRGSMDASEYKHVVLGLISGCRPKRAGRTSKRRRGSPRSSSSTTPWPAWSATTPLKDVLPKEYVQFELAEPLS